jgi:hypothetical protein
MNKRMAYPGMTKAEIAASVKSEILDRAGWIRPTSETPFFSEPYDDADLIERLRDRLTIALNAMRDGRI